ncbi:MAG: hypothetical protein NUV77_25995 [Thermoguttaceae bacterium]|jgi:hypothetical protein|nr:hypothetical protein [Thermoguttaceae bacterium]
MAAKLDPYWKWLGIPPEEQPPNYYRLLGIALFESDPEVISNAADRQMAHVRSYQTGPHALLSQRLLNELSAARICLLDAARKAEYDARLRPQTALQPESRQVASPVFASALVEPPPLETPGDAIPLPFSTEPSFLAELETEAIEPQPAPGPTADGLPEILAVGPGRRAANSRRPLRRRRSPGLGLAMGLAGVVVALLLAAFTWIWTHSSGAGGLPSSMDVPPGKRATTGSSTGR